MYSWPAPHGRQATCRAFISLLVLITPQLCLSQPPAVIRLKDSDFEQKTQAATGQTTGTWCVLFTVKDQRAVKILWDKLATAQADGGTGLLFGHVSTDSNPDLAERFDIKKSNTPTARLFKDRKMYSYAGPQQASAAMRTALKSFCLSPDLPAQEVPGPLSTLNKPLSKIMRDLILRVDSLPTGQRFGVFGVVVGIFIFLWVLARGYFIRMPYEKMELQAKKGR